MDGNAIAALISLLAGSLRISIPITFAALGATFSERSGIVNIGLEGMMLAGAFAGVLGSDLTGSPLIGLLFAIVTGAAFALFHAILTIKYKTDHIISGVGINLLSLGLTTVLLQVIWGNRGKSDQVAGLGTVSIPVLKDIPVAGEILGNNSPLFYLMIALIIISWIVLFKTTYGLRIRVVGENPEVADTVGINVYAIQYVCVIISGILAGLGGAYLSLGEISLFGRDMVAGRGYIALAAVIFGRWNPLGVFGGSLLFGFAQSLQMRLQGIGLPVQFVQMLPYLVTIAVLAFYHKHGRGPAAAGKHFRRGEI